MLQPLRLLPLFLGFLPLNAGRVLECEGLSLDFAIVTDDLVPAHIQRRYLAKILDGLPVGLSPIDCITDSVDIVREAFWFFDALPPLLG